MSKPLSFRAFLLVLWTALATAPESASQIADSASIRFGFGAAWLRNAHSANFDTIPGVASCCRQQYGGAESQGFAFDAMGEYPIVRFDANAVASLSLKAMFASGLGANLSALERVQIQGGVAVIRHELETTLSALAFEPAFVARLFKRFTLGVGARASFFTQADYQYRERIIEPDDIVYANGQTVFNGATGALPQLNAAQFHLVGSASYEFPANRAGTILPTLEASYAFPLNTVVGGADWRVATLKLGVGLRFSPYRTTELTAQEIEELFRDSLRQAQDIAQKALAEAGEAKKKQLSARISSLRPVDFDDEGNEEKTDEQSRDAATPIGIRVQKFQAREAFSLLPTIYFDELSALVPSRYKTFSSRSQALSTPATEWFCAGASLRAEESRALNEKIHYQVLNIIGRRMVDFPNALLVARGFALDSERDAANLAERQASGVAAYLENIWGAPARRIRIETSVIRTTGAQAEALSEGRKVILWSDSPEILAPAHVESEKIAVSPSAIALGMQINAGQGLKQWSLECSQLQGREIQTLHAASGGSNYPNEYMWDLRPLPPQASEPLSVSLSIDDVNNNKFEAPIVAIPVQEESAQQPRIHLWTIAPADTAHLRQALLLVKELAATAPVNTSARLRIAADENSKAFVQELAKSILGADVLLSFSQSRAGNNARAGRNPENSLLERCIRLLWR